MKSNKNNKPSIKLGDKPTVVAKNATSQKSIQIYSISDTVNVYLSDCSLKNNNILDLIFLIMITIDQLIEKLHWIKAAKIKKRSVR